MDILKIKKFLDNGDGNGNGYGDGNGYGNGDGDGYGNGNGNGNGYGNGYGYGNGDGYGNGYGNGDGDGIKNINGYDVYVIDETPTILTHIHGNIAKGFMIERNVNLIPCYVVKGHGYFAHGETLAQAQEALEEKIIDDMDIEEKIQLFKEKFPDINKQYPAKDFYQWYHNLTGSCEMGRKTFASNHNIDIKSDVMTVKEFMDLTENAYCGEVIRQLRESYKRR